MPLERTNARRYVIPLLFLILLVGVSQVARAHAILVESRPNQNSTVEGPAIEILLRFNVRIDVARSRMKLVSPGGSVVNLNTEKQTSPDSMKAIAITSKSGAYTILWQVLASDGHVTRGEIPFSVK